MAKLTAPLFSFGARAQLGKALVFFNWKGIHAVRQYVIPANPNTAAQQTQRGYMGDAVDEFHGAAYNALDMGAWNRWATTIKAILSGFNQMVKTFLSEVIAGGTWTRIHLAEVDAVTGNGFVARVYCGTGQPVFHYGLTRTWMPELPAVIPAGPANQFEADLGGLLAANTEYYYYWDYGTAGADYGRTGIYYQKTNA